MEFCQQFYNKKEKLVDININRNYSPWLMDQKILTICRGKPNLLTYNNKRRYSASNHCISILVMCIFLLFLPVQCSHSHLQKHNSQQQSSFLVTSIVQQDQEANRQLESTEDKKIDGNWAITSRFQQNQQSRIFNGELDDSDISIVTNLDNPINGNSFEQISSSKNTRIEKQQNLQVSYHKHIQSPLILSSKVKRILAVVNQDSINQDHPQVKIDKEQKQNQPIQSKQKKEPQAVNKNDLSNNQISPQVKNEKAQNNPGYFSNINKLRETLKSSISSNPEIQKQNQLTKKQSFVSQSGSTTSSVLSQQESQINSGNKPTILVEGVKQENNKKPKIASSVYINTVSPIQYTYPYQNTYPVYLPSPYPYQYPYSSYPYPYANPQYINPYYYPQAQMQTQVQTQVQTQAQSIAQAQAQSQAIAQAQSQAIAQAQSQAQQKLQQILQQKSQFPNIASAIIRGASLTQPQTNIILPQNIPTKVVEKTNKDGSKLLSIEPAVTNESLQTLVTNNLVNSVINNLVPKASQNFYNVSPVEKVIHVTNITLNSTDKIIKSDSPANSIITTTVISDGVPVTTRTRIIQVPNSNFSKYVPDGLIQPNTNQNVTFAFNSSKVSTVKVPLNQSDGVSIPLPPPNSASTSQINKSNPTNSISPTEKPPTVIILPANNGSGSVPIPQKNPPGKTLGQIPQTIASIQSGRPLNTTNIIQPENNTIVYNSPVVVQDIPRKASKVTTTNLSYQQYLAKFRPNFKTNNPDELSVYRNTIFNLNIQKIQQVNVNENVNYSYTINKFTSLPIQQFNALFNLLKPPPLKGNITIIKPAAGTPNVNWTCASRKPIAQGNCGACYAISGVDTAEITFQMYDFNVRDMSIQQILSCAPKNQNNLGCEGGYFSSIFQYLQIEGIGQSAAYRYLLDTKQRGSIPPCNKTFYYSEAYNSTRVKIKNSVIVPSGNCQELVDQLKFRAIAVGIAASGLQFYEGGKFDIQTANKNVNEVNHGVVLLGYDQQLGYWFKNSWGLAWGIGGYGFVGENSGICLYAMYPILEQQVSPPKCPQRQP